MREARSIVDLQRARLLSAAIGVLAGQGYAEFTAAAVCERAGVSRRTFYEIFENREQCLAAILAEAEQRASATIARLGVERLAWAERIRMGLWAILCLADEDPALAKVCLVESQRAGAGIQRERARIIAGLVNALDEGRLRGSSSAVASRLTAEALIGAVSSVIATRLMATSEDEEHVDSRDSEDRMGVRGLLGELVGMIVLPYQGPTAARRQIKLAPPAAPVVPLTGIARNASGPDPLAQLPMRLTYRTARVLRAVAELSDGGAGASNRQVAERAGVSDAGQASKLLSRLQEHGLLENAAVGSRERGEANSWRLTSIGRRLVQSITAQAGTTDQRRSAA